MKVYLAAPIKGVRNALPTVKKVARALFQNGHEVLTPHVADEDVINRERDISPCEIYERDLKLLEEADVLVAEVSYPSLGVGYEIAHALLIGKKVIAICRRDRLEHTSSMIKGITHPNFVLFTYTSPEEAASRVLKALANLNAERT